MKLNILSLDKMIVKNETSKIVGLMLINFIIKLGFLFNQFFYRRIFLLYYFFKLNCSNVFEDTCGFEEYIYGMFLYHVKYCSL
jgi:hypothetical protein